MGKLFSQLIKDKSKTIENESKESNKHSASQNRKFKKVWRILTFSSSRFQSMIVIEKNPNTRRSKVFNQNIKSNDLKFKATSR